MRLSTAVRLGEDAVEWMDAGRGAPAEIASCYEELELVNRRLGGLRATLRHLDWLRGRAGPWSLLDVAGGDGRFAAAVVDRARRADLDPRATVLDLHPIGIRLARRRDDPAIGAVRGEALALPFRDRSFDVVHTAAFAHHLSTPGAFDLLVEMCRVSRRAVVVNDLVRSPIAKASIWTLTRLCSHNRLVRHDGPLSVAKSFRPRELGAIARAAGATTAPGFRWRLTRTFPYRMTLVGVRCDRR